MVECQPCNLEVAGSNLGLGYYLKGLLSLPFHSSGVDK